jgi:hypothetical protein
VNQPSHDRDTRAELSPRWFGIFVLIVLFLVLVFVAYDEEVNKWSLGDLEHATWIYHDKMTTVYVHNWVNGEYKHCSNINANNHDKPYLMCDDANLDTEPGKVFDVRFYGLTYDEKLPFTTTFDWNCKRGDSEPMIVCKRTTEKPE